MAHEDNAVVNTPATPLEYHLSGAKTEKQKGIQSDAAVVVQTPKDNVVNSITVKEVKDEVKKGVGQVKQCDCEPLDCPVRYQVDNIASISGTILEKLKCGDVVVKHTVSSSKDLYHTYIVTHKQATGICMTYFAAGYLETVSYDKIEGEWTYNSTDVWTAQ